MLPLQPGSWGTEQGEGDGDGSQGEAGRRHPARVISHRGLFLDVCPFYSPSPLCLSLLF